MEAIKFNNKNFKLDKRMKVSSPACLPFTSQTQINIFSNDHVAWLNYLYHFNDPANVDADEDETEEIKIQRIILPQDLSVQGQLGEGAQGNIYLVRYNTDEKFALKVCPKNKPLGNMKNCEIQNEAKILGSLHHPFIIKFFGEFETAEHKLFLLEFGQGGDLLYHHGKVQKLAKKFSESTVKFYISGLALALDYIHDRGYIYRDLKPENVLIDKNGYPKIGDFGLSISQSDIDFKTGRKQCGTKEYFSPEMIKREIYGKEVDWWSLGILTYELLFNETPFEDSNVFVANNNIKTKEPSFLKRDDLSSDCVDFISQLLSKDQNNRLGKNGIDDFINHPWLKEINWEDIELKNSPCPYSIEGVSPSETHFFGDEYTQRSFDLELL